MCNFWNLGSWPSWFLSRASSPMGLLFLAPRDYVSRAHEIAIVRRPSIRPSVLQLSLNLRHEFLSNFGCCFSWAIRWDFFVWIFEKKFFFHLLQIFFFVFLNIGPYGAKIFKTLLLLLQTAAESFQTFSEYSSIITNGPHTITFGIFEILKMEF